MALAATNRRRSAVGAIALDADARSDGVGQVFATARFAAPPGACSRILFEGSPEGESMVSDEKGGCLYLGQPNRLKACLGPVYVCDPGNRPQNRVESSLMRQTIAGREKVRNNPLKVSLSLQNTCLLDAFSALRAAARRPPSRLVLSAWQKLHSTWAFPSAVANPPPSQTL